MKQFLFPLFLLVFAACHKSHSTDLNDLVGTWTATSITIDGTKQAATTTMTLAILADKTFTIVTSLTDFNHAKTGAWSATADNSALTLADVTWTIHHLTASTLRIEAKAGTKSYSLEFSK